MQWTSCWIRIELGRRTVRPAVQIWVTAVTGGPVLPCVNFILSASLLCLVVCCLKAPSRLLQMRLYVAAGRVRIYRHRVGQKRWTVPSKGAALWWWYCWSRRARTWGSPRERAHLSPVVRELMQPGYMSSITSQVREIERLSGRKIQQRTNIAGIQRIPLTHFHGASLKRFLQAF